MKRNEGITLIALIITIVILIILTAITINNITSTNLFGLAQKAAENYIEAGEKEESAIDELMSKVSELEKGLGNGGTDGGTEEETEDEDLYRYILGEGKTGRDLSEISNILEAGDISDLKFQKDNEMETDMSGKVSVLATGPDRVDIYIKYENKVYRVPTKMVIESNGIKVLSTALKKVYEQTGLEGQKVQYSYDGQETNKKDWTIIKDNKNGTVDIVSPDVLGNLTLGAKGSISSEQPNENVNKAIDDYNEAIKKINEECTTQVTNTNKVSVRSVGAATDDSGTYTSHRITEWTSQYSYLSSYNGVGKTGDEYYEDDLVRMSYHGIVSTGTAYWVASRYILDCSSDVCFFVKHIYDDGSERKHCLVACTQQR